MKNDFAEDLQRQIDRDLRKVYSTKVLDHWKNPKNWGIMNNACGYGKIAGPCGDTMEISIKAGNNKIIKCTYDTDGCGASIACGSMVTEMATGKTIKEARQITQDKVLQFCGGLPESDKHCALLAVNTLQKAIDDWLLKGGSKMNDDKGGKMFEKEYEKNLERTTKIARKRRYVLNQDKGRVKKVVGLMTNNYIEFGKYYCPCKQSHPLNPEKDVICPCSVLEEEIEKDGHCYCRLFFNNE